MKFDGAKLLEIEVKTKASAQGYNGRIVALHSDVNIIVLETSNGRISVSLTDKSLVLSPLGVKYKFSDLKEGDLIFAYGVKDGLYVKADKILILE